MTYEEALDVLMNKIQIDVNFTEDFNRDYDCLTKCKEAVEKQIPKKPETRYGITYYCPPDCGGKEFDEYGDILICPSCRKDIEDDKYCKHCKECGQAIDWSGKK